MAAKRRLDGKRVLELLDDMSSDFSGDSEQSQLEDHEILSDSDGDGFSSEDGDSSEEDDGDRPQIPSQWQLLNGVANGFKHLPFSFTTCGLQIADEELPNTELGFFQLFYSGDILNEFVSYTNTYAEARLANMELRPHSVWHKWSNVTMDEMKAYLGVIMNMALNQKPGLFDYFSTSWLDKMSFFTDVFSRHRFLQIHWMFHPGPAGNEANNKGYKINNIIRHMKEKCLQHYFPGPNIAIDESTIAFKGRVSFRMYNPQKPTKWGLRVYVLADSETGYISVFEPYYGKETTDSLIRQDLPFTSRIVIHLCQELQTKTKATGYHLFTDRFYTGFFLAQELLKMQIHCTGTVMRNRQGLPVEIKKLKMARHETKAFTKDNVMVLAWQDKRQVLMLTTFFDASTRNIRRKNKSSTAVIQKPLSVIEYTNNMGAVDRADHLCTSYNFERKSVKWWRKMFFYLLEVALVNSYILFHIAQEKNNEKPQLSHLQYRKKVIEQLVGSVRSQRKKRGRRSNQDFAERLNNKTHFLGQVARGSSKDCAVCSNRKVPGERRKTVYFCKTCSGHPGLHPTDCFERYHSLINYKH